MKTPTTKFAILSLLLVFVALACSRPAQPEQQGRNYTHDPSKPQFTIAAADLAAPPVLGTNSAPTGAHATIVLRIQFTAAKTDAFHKFTREHKNQQTQLVVGSKIVAEPTIVAEIADGRTELMFSSIEEAREVRDLLNKK